MVVPTNLESSDGWWDYLQADRVSKIQWTPKCGGWVRSRLDSITPWAYQQCGNAKNAESIGEALIERQKARKCA